jgi:hypothetical protein
MTETMMVQFRMMRRLWRIAARCMVAVAVLPLPAQEQAFTTSGYQLLSDNVDKIEPAGSGFFRVSAADNVYLINPSTNSAWGKFDDIRVEGDFLFFKDEDGWGAATISHKGLAPRRFENVYIVKNKTNFGVLVKNRDGWALYDSNGVSDGIQYDLAPKELAKQVKKLKLPETPYGLIEVNWDL